MTQKEFRARSELLDDGMCRWRDSVARSQAIFREVNERIEEVADVFGFDADGYESLVCECGNPGCVQRIELNRVEYERIRQHASRFVVAHNHENPETESIVEENERFVVVETYAGASSRIARDTDPRSQRRLRVPQRIEESPAASQEGEL